MSNDPNRQVTEDDLKEVPLNLNDSATLPRRMVLTRFVQSATGHPRQFTIRDPKQKVPRLVKDWMLQDRRYKGWFDEEYKPRNAQKAKDDPPAKATAQKAEPKPDAKE